MDSETAQLIALRVMTTQIFAAVLAGQPMPTPEQIAKSFEQELDKEVEGTKTCLQCRIRREEPSTWFKLKFLLSRAFSRT